MVWCCLKLAPVQVAIVPIYKNDEQLAQINEVAAKICAELKALGISYKYDNDDTKKPGWKFAEYELKGVPVRLAIGPRDIENQTLEMARRDTLTKEVVPMAGIADQVKVRLTTSKAISSGRPMPTAKPIPLRVDNENLRDCLTKRVYFPLPLGWYRETEELIKNETKAT